MARRDQPTPQDPAVEESHAELSILEGNKNAVQTETLSIADNKKRLEVDYGDRKRQIEDELTLKRREADLEKEALEKQNLNLKTEGQSVAQENQKVRAENAGYSAAAVIIKDSIARDEKTKEALTTSVKALTVSKNELQTSVNDLTPKVAELTKKVELLTADVTSLEKRKKDAIDGHVAKAAALEAVTKSHDTLVMKRDEKQTEVNELDKTIAEKREELAKATSSVAEAELQVAAHRKEMFEKDKDSSERAARAARLEQHVQGKLEDLKEIEKQFTTEHLARFGYKKTQ